MRLFFLKLLMKLSGSVSPRYVEKVNQKLIKDWLESLASSESGYKHYYTWRKKHIMEGMVSGMTQEQYWINHGRILELQFINALSVRELKKK